MNPYCFDEIEKLMQSGEYRAARKLLFRRRAESKEEEARRLCTLARSYDCEGRLERALDLARRAMETMPGNQFYEGNYSSLLGRVDIEEWIRWHRKNAGF